MIYEALTTELVMQRNRLNLSEKELEVLEWHEHKIFGNNTSLKEVKGRVQ